MPRVSISSLSSDWARTPTSLPAVQLWFVFIPTPEAATRRNHLVLLLQGQPNPLPWMHKGPTHKHLETHPIQLPLFLSPAQKILAILAVPHSEFSSQATMLCLDSRSENCSQAESRGNHGVHFMNFKTTGLLPKTWKNCLISWFSMARTSYSIISKSRNCSQSTFQFLLYKDLCWAKLNLKLWCNQGHYGENNLPFIHSFIHLSFQQILTKAPCTS